MGDKQKPARLRRRIRNNSAWVIAIQETKLQEVSENAIKHLWGNINYKWEHVLAQRASGGLLTIWDAKKVKKISSLAGALSLSVEFENRGNNTRWIHTNIYGPVGNIEKKEL